jgi:hypothetical protein
MARFAVVAKLGDNGGSEAKGVGGTEGAGDGVAPALEGAQTDTEEDRRCDALPEG